MTKPRGIWVTLGGFAAAVGLVATVWPFVPKFQTVEAAESHNREDARAFATLAHGQAQILTIVLRSQVNECVMQAARMKQDERAVCDRYRHEYEQAERKARALYRETLNQEKRK